MGVEPPLKAGLKVIDDEREGLAPAEVADVSYHY